MADVYVAVARKGCSREIDTVFFTDCATVEELGKYYDNAAEEIIRLEPMPVDPENSIGGAILERLAYLHVHGDNQLGSALENLLTQAVCWGAAYEKTRKGDTV